MKPHDGVKYLLKNGEKRTMWWTDGPLIFVVKPGNTGFIKYDINGLTIDRTKCEYDIVDLADPPKMERIVPRKLLPNHEKGNEKAESKKPTSFFFKK